MSRKQDVAKARYWQETIGEAVRSGMSVREFCRLRKLDVAQFYWWRRRLRETKPPRTMGKPGGDQARFALVADGADPTEAGIELVLGNGRRLRLHRGVDEATLRSVLAALERPAC